MIRVLLLSPVPGRDPLSGDTSYTEALLQQPPPGVQYTTYDEAIRDGRVLIRGRRRYHGRQAMVDRVILGARIVEHSLRRAQLMFREEFGYYTIQSDAFDLVHSHLFSIRQINSKVPVVSSAGYPLTELYRYRERWKPLHVNMALRLEEFAARACQVDVPWLGNSTSGVITVYTDHFRNWLVRRGVPQDRVLLAGTGLPDLELASVHRQCDGRTLGFIGRDFNRKGGQIAIEVLRLLRNLDQSWKMIVVTSDRHSINKDEPGVEIHHDPERSKILREILPRLDILLLLTESDCGAPYGLLEALQMGVHAIISNYPWLDSRLIAPAVVRMPFDPPRIAGYVANLSSEDLKRSQTAARKLWHETFSMSSLHTDLLHAYELALSGSSR